MHLPFVYSFGCKLCFGLWTPLLLTCRTSVKLSVCESDCSVERLECVGLVERVVTVPVGYIPLGSVLDISVVDLTTLLDYWLVERIGFW